MVLVVRGTLAFVLPTLSEMVHQGLGLLTTADRYQQLTHGCCGWLSVALAARGLESGNVGDTAESSNHPAAQASRTERCLELS